MSDSFNTTYLLRNRVSYVTLRQVPNGKDYEMAGKRSVWLRFAALMAFTWGVAISPSTRCYADRTSQKASVSYPSGSFVMAGGHKVWYESEGRGEAILLIPGGPGFSHDLFHPFFSPLSDQYRIIYYDPFGTGKSERAQDPAESIHDPAVARDQSFIVFDYGKVKGGLGRLCIAFRQGDHWSKPIDLGDDLDKDFPGGSHLDPDGHTVYFRGKSGIQKFFLAPWLDAHRH